jgi:hypothetical protein
MATSLSALRTGRILLPRKIIIFSISKMKKFTSLGLDPATFWFVAQTLRYRFTPTYIGIKFKLYCWDIFLK